MSRYLMLKLHGIMQAWGGHTYEDLRHSEIFPTRSGVLGLLGACLGIDRKDVTKLMKLDTSLIMAVRSDSRPIKITDFHTVEGARKVDGSVNTNQVLTRREYLCDAAFTLALKNTPNATITIDKIHQNITNPVYTPFLGRRACPLTRPLYEKFVEAESFVDAFAGVEPVGGTVYSEETLDDTANRLLMRDVPVYGLTRKFATRNVFFKSD